MKTNSLIHLGSRKSVTVSSILMLKADINYTFIFLDDGTKILSSTNIGILEQRLKGFDFFRPNRSVIVNLRYVEHGSENNIPDNFLQVRVRNNPASDTISIPLSRRKSKPFFDLLMTR